MNIYYAKIESLSEEDVQYAMHLLPKERIEKIERRKQEKSRLQSIFAGLLLEYALRETGLIGKNLTFLENPDGKPYIAEYPKLHYNLSHSNRYAALVMDDCSVGIDVEENRADCKKLVKRFFAEEECAALEEQWSDAFFTKLWTRKESYLKAVGFGMRMPLAGFSTLKDYVELNDKMYSELIEPGAAYYLDSIQIDKDCWLSVCKKNEPVVLERENCLIRQVDVKKQFYKWL